MRYVSPCLILVCVLVFTACGDTQTTDETQTAEAVLMEPDIRAEAVEYTAGEVTLKGYLAYDANVEGRRPGVLVVHEWWGHNEYARRRARMLAELGYTTGSEDEDAYQDQAGAYVAQEGLFLLNRRNTNRIAKRLHDSFSTVRFFRGCISGALTVAYYERCNRGKRRGEGVRRRRGERSRIDDGEWRIERREAVAVRFVVKPRSPGDQSPGSAVEGR